MTPLEETLQAMIEPVVEETGYELVRLRLTGARTKTLQIMAERPDGTMTAEDCARLSRAISVMMDEQDPVSDQYTLEVSSPGIDRPLTRFKDFERWEGFDAKIELTQMVEGQKRFRGVLAGVEDDNVCVDLDGEEETALIPYNIIASAKLMMTDELITESLRRAKSAQRQPNSEVDTAADVPGEEK